MRFQVVQYGNADSVWKKKWEGAQAEFSAAKAMQAQIKTELKQQLERTQTQNVPILLQLVSLTDTNSVFVGALSKRSERFGSQSHGVSDKVQ